MSDLAYNINGEAFDVPAIATGWRVRRMKPRGAPEVVYGRDGVPLSLPIEADLEELRRAIETPGRFRLDAIDEHGKALPDLPAAYIVVSAREEAPVAQSIVAVPLDSPNAVIAEAMRLNNELARSVIDRFPEMMTAAAELLRAADGAGLPARQPRAEAGDDEEDVVAIAPQPSISPVIDMLTTLVAQAVPAIVTAFASKKGPPLAAVLDWRKAVPETTSSEDTPSRPPERVGAESAELPPLDPKAMSHFIAIQSALTPNEAALARQVAAELTPTDMRAWFAELSTLSVPEAVAKIRSFVGEISKKGAAA